MFAVMKSFLSGLLLVLAVWSLAAAPGALAATESAGGHHFMTAGKTWAQAIWVLVAMLTLFVAEIWFIVAGFKTSVGWGLFMLFIGGLRSLFAALAMLGWLVQWIWITHSGGIFKAPALVLAVFVVFAGTGAVLFICRHWDRARKPLLVMVTAFLMVAPAVGLEFLK
jgi:hypothetical protein